MSHRLPLNGTEYSNHPAVIHAATAGANNDPRLNNPSNDQ